MDVYDALRFSVARISNELFSAGSIFSVYSLATTFVIAVCALAYQRKMRRGRVNLRAIARAIFSRKILLTASFAADVKLFVLSVVLMPVVVGALVISSNAVATVVSAGAAQFIRRDRAGRLLRSVDKGLFYRRAVSGL